jgi:hypothetical protein
MLTTSQWKAALPAVRAFAFVLALGTTIVGASGEPESGQGKPSFAIQPQTYEGMITDTHCGAKHSTAIGETATDCTIICIRAGEHFVLVDGDTTYLLDGDLFVLKRAAGKRVRIIGSLNGKTISVTAVVTT